MSSEEPRHVRRKRYRGTHPRSFREKYKELQPDRYASEVDKVIAQGRTPAGMHRPICVSEIMDALMLEPGQMGLDATLGYGGHTLEILKRIQPGGILYATDIDPIELTRTEGRLRALGYSQEALRIRNINFAAIGQIVAEAGLLNFVLADLGVSSMQIDNPDRGFSYKIEGPLDLRLNPMKGKPAWALLKITPEDILESILTENADEPYAQPIARAIATSIAGGMPIETTAQLHSVIRETLGFLPKVQRDDEVRKACQRVFQALRIAVNDELGALEKFLEELPFSLAPGGRVAILSFHSGEDRRVKKSFQHFQRLGYYSEIAPTPIRPTAEECNANPRARSAKLRWAVKA